MPGSVVTTVTHEETPEEEYDPARPMIGRVASMVKVGPRRPTLPPSRQASSALVMKAMTEAQESVEKSANKQKQVERAYVRPIQQRLGSSDGPPAPRGRGRGLARHSSSSREEIHLSSQYSSSARGPASRMRSAAMPAPRRLPQTTPINIKPEPVSPKERSVQLLSQTRRDEELQRLQFEADEAEAEAKRLAEDVVELEVKQESPEMDWAMEAIAEDKKLLELSASSVQSAEVVYHPTPIPQDSRQVTCDPPPEREQQPVIEQRTISVKPRLQSTSSEMDMLVEGGADEFDLEEDSRRVHESTPIKENPPSPKFVVTLDGAEPEMMQLSEISDVDLQEEDPKLRNIVRVKPQIMMQQHMYFNPEDVPDDGVSPPKAKRFPERCKFWPACMKGETCPFHHPTEPCMKFPKCRFGDKCAYLHPQCRFDGRCTRSDCAYLHLNTNKGPSAPIPQANMPVMIQPVGVLPMQSPVDQSGMFFEQQPMAAPQAQRPTRCKFFPNCTNLECPYVHPKPCRFGSACRNQPHCTFSHPPLPSKDQLKWTASKQPSASSALPPS